MSERQGGADNAQAAGNLGGTPVKAQAGLSARLAHHLNLKPVDPEADACAQRLGCGFLGGEACSKTFGGVALALAVGLLGREINAIEEASAEAIHGVLDARNLDQINSGASDHLVYQATTFLPEFAGQNAERGPRSEIRRGEMKRVPMTEECFSTHGAAQDVSKAVRPVRLRNRIHPVRPNSDIQHVKMKMQEASRRQALSIPWAMQMKAVSTEDPSRLVQALTGAILGCGGWVLSRGANDSGRVNMLFEFERQACVDIYTILIASGLELSQNGHVRLTELCQCTRSQQRDCGAEIASVDLEVQTFPPEIVDVMQTPGPV